MRPSGGRVTAMSCSVAIVAERAQLLGLLLQRGGDARSQLVGGGEHAVEGAVFVEQRRGGLGADSLGARQPVGGVAAQRDQIGDLCRRDAAPLCHAGRVDRARRSVAAQLDDRRVRVDGLVEVAVARADQRVAAGCPFDARIGPHQVVGLERVVCRDRPAERLEQRWSPVPLGAQLGRHRVAVGVVGRIERHAVVGLLGAEAADDGARGAPLHEDEDRVDGAEQRADRCAVSSLDRARQAEVRAVEQPRRVDREQRAAHGVGPTAPPPIEVGPVGAGLERWVRLPRSAPWVRPSARPDRAANRGAGRPGGSRRAGGNALRLRARPIPSRCGLCGGGGDGEARPGAVQAERAHERRPADRRLTLAPDQRRRDDSRRDAPLGHNDRLEPPAEQALQLPRSLSERHRDRAEAGRVIGVENRGQVRLGRCSGERVLHVFGLSARAREVVGRHRRAGVGHDLAGGRRDGGVGCRSLRVVAAVFLRAGVGVEIEAVLGRARDRVATSSDRLSLELGGGPGRGALRRHDTAQVALESDAIDHVQTAGGRDDPQAAAVAPVDHPAYRASVERDRSRARDRERRGQVAQQAAVLAFERDLSARRPWSRCRWRGSAASALRRAWRRRTRRFGAPAATER